MPAMSNALQNAEKKLRQGKLADAHKLLSRLLKKTPDNPQALYLMGETLLLQKRLDEALIKLNKAISSGDAQPCWYVMCGAALEKKGLFEDAEKSYKLAEMSGCTDERMYFMLGNFYTTISQNNTKAELYFTSLISINPNAFLGYVGLSKLYINQERYEDAIQALEYCLNNGYEKANVYINLAHALSHQGRQEDALSCNRKAIELEPYNAMARQNCIVQLLYTLDDQADIHREVTKLTAMINDLSKTRFTGKVDCTTDRKLRLGLVSADLRNHAISHYFLPVYRHLNKDIFSLHIYYNNYTFDHITEEIKNRADAWCSCRTLDDNQFAEQVISDNIDILVDLSNHTAGNRLPAFRKKIAPMQVSWMGIPVSTGLSYMDYSLKDSSLLTSCDLDENSTEKILPVDGLTLYDPLGELPPLVEPPCISNGYITFGSFNGLHKVNEAIFDIWAKLLHQVKGSTFRMVIEDFNNSLMKDYIYDQFAKFDVDKTRVILQPRQSLDEYMASHNLVDIALDPYPYHGETTTYNSLLMGLPLVSRAGRSAASNIATRILTTINHKEWLASNFDEYIDIAISLTMDFDKLALIRKTLRSEVMNSLIMDYEGVTRRIESALLHGWKGICERYNPKEL
jgi:predicted O-linked N-acetylglucosamine transferase (SPINDLY family)